MVCIFSGHGEIQRCTLILKEFIRSIKDTTLLKVKNIPKHALYAYVASANTVDGQTTITLTKVKDFVRLINDGNADWCLVGGAYS